MFHAVADPGVPRGGANLSFGKFVTENRMKVNEIGSKGGCAPSSLWIRRCYVVYAEILGNPHIIYLFRSPHNNICFGSRNEESIVFYKNLRNFICIMWVKCIVQSIHIHVQPTW